MFFMTEFSMRKKQTQLKNIQMNLLLKIEKVITQHMSMHMLMVTFVIRSIEVLMAKAKLNSKRQFFVSLTTMFNMLHKLTKNTLIMNTSQLIMKNIISHVSTQSHMMELLQTRKMRKEMMCLMFQKSDICLAKMRPPLI